VLDLFRPTKMRTDQIMIQEVQFIHIQLRRLNLLDLGELLIKFLTLNQNKIQGLQLWDQRMLGPLLPLTQKVKGNTRIV
jgi:hypothetical protein